MEVTLAKKVNLSVFLSSLQSRLLNSQLEKEQVLLGAIDMAFSELIATLDFTDG